MQAGLNANAARISEEFTSTVYWSEGPWYWKTKQNKDRTLLWISSLPISPLPPGTLFYSVSHAPLPETGTWGSVGQWRSDLQDLWGSLRSLQTCRCRKPVGTEALGNGGATRLGRSLGPCMEEHLLTAKWTDVKGRNTPCVKPLRFRGCIL